MKKTITTSKPTSIYIYLLLGTLLLLLLSPFFYKRFDLTQDKRYTLSDTTIQIIEQIKDPLEIEVLLSGESTSEFRRLQQETAQILEEFASKNKYINFRLIHSEELDLRKDLQNKIRDFQIKPAQVQIQQDGKTQTAIIFPWAFANYNGKTVPIALLKNQLGASSEERIHNSVQNLEYSFVDAFNKLIHPKHKRIAFLKGNEETEDKYLIDFLSTLKENYFIAPFTLHASESADALLTDLNTYDLLVVTEPKKAFSEEHKYLIDQYLMQGGNLLWLGSANQQVQHPDTGETYLIGLDLEMTDMFFKYGIRIQNNVVKDMYAAPILIASGEERDSQYDRYPWFFYPLIESDNPHPITTNTDIIKFEYASSIDTLPNAARKTILLHSSPLNKSISLPYPIDLNIEIAENLGIINEGIGLENFRNQPLNLAVLVEGEIPSAYSHRVKPIRWKTWKDIEQNTDGKLLVISDGSIIRNQMDGNRPLELGYDKWTHTFYGNKEFLLNSVNYMLDDDGLITLRSKTIAIPFLDTQLAIEQRRMWQYFNLITPLAILAIFGLVFRFIRKRKYVL